MDGLEGTPGLQQKRGSPGVIRMIVVLVENTSARADFSTEGYGLWLGYGWL